jgi:hypothetical protein
MISVSFLFLTNSNGTKNLGALFGFFTLGILDIGIQLETIKYGNLKFSFYDILWFFGIFLISLFADDFSHRRIDISESNSLKNLIRKFSFVPIASLTILFFYLTSGFFDISPMYLIFFVLSVFLISILLSLAVHSHMKQYNLFLRQFLRDDSSPNLEKIVKNVPEEFRLSLIDIHNFTIENELKALAAQKQHCSETISIFKRMAHDIASPLTVLDAISSTSQGLSSEKMELLALATKRIRSIANDIFRQEMNSKKMLNQELPILTSLALARNNIENYN